MLIKEITISKKIQETQYEPIEISMTASVGEDEDVGKSVDDLRFLVEYKLREESRNDRYEVIQKELESGNSVRGKELTEDEVKQRNTWIDKYNESKERFNSLEFK